MTLWVCLHACAFISTLYLRLDHHIYKLTGQTHYSVHPLTECVKWLDNQPFVLLGLGLDV